jgi:hypothetical protein
LNLYQYFIFLVYHFLIVTFCFFAFLIEGYFKLISIVIYNIQLLNEDLSGVTLKAASLSVHSILSKLSLFFIDHLALILKITALILLIFRHDHS